MWPQLLSKVDLPCTTSGCLPACMFKPLQMIQNVASQLVFNQPKTAHHPTVHIAPLVPSFIKFKTLTLAYKTATITAPTYLMVAERVTKLHLIRRVPLNL